MHQTVDNNEDRERREWITFLDYQDEIMRPIHVSKSGFKYVRYKGKKLSVMQLERDGDILSFFRS